MLLSKGYTIFIALDYAKFVEQVTWFGMMCALQPLSKKNVYVEGFKSLQDAYNRIRRGAEIDEETDRIVQDLFVHVQSLLKRRKFTEETILTIAELMANFQRDHSITVNTNVLKALIDRAERLTYKSLLLEKVSHLFGSDAYDEVVLNAFKFVDSYLQQLLILKPHEFYGEDLINRAFAPNSGTLQINTHTNEQTGLRNFVSGVNAIFRNPSAHRRLLDSSKATFRGDGEFYADAVVVIAELIARIATELYAKKFHSQIHELLQRLIERNNWTKFIASYADAWSAAPLLQKTVDTFDKQKWQLSSDYRVHVQIVTDAHQVFFEVDSHESVSGDDVRWLSEEIYKLTELPVRKTKSKLPHVT